MTQLPPTPGYPLEPQSGDPWALPPQIRRREDFDVGEVFSRAWAAFKANYGMLMAVVAINFGFGIAQSMVSWIVSFVVSIAAGGGPNHPAGQVASWVIDIVVGIFINIPMNAGVAFAGVKAARGRAIAPMDAFLGFKRYWSVIAVGILTGLIVGGCLAPFACLIGVGAGMAGAWGGGSGMGAAAIVALVVAGVLAFAVVLIVSARLSMATMICVDEAWGRLDPVQCIQASWRLTAPIWGRVILLNLCVAGIAIGSFFLLCIGFLLLGLPLSVAIGGMAYAMASAVYLQANCPRCGYDITGLSGEFCPECGAAVDGSGDVQQHAGPHGEPS